MPDSLHWAKVVTRTQADETRTKEGLINGAGGALRKKPKKGRKRGDFSPFYRVLAVSFALRAHAVRWLASAS